MKRQRPLHPVILQQMFAPPHFIQNFARQIFSFEQQTKFRFIERGIVQQRHQHVRRRIVQECRKLLAGSDQCAVASCRRLGHPNISQRVLPPPLATFAMRRFSRAARLALAPHPLAHHKTRTGPPFPLFSRFPNSLRAGPHELRPFPPERLAGAPLPAKSRAPLNLRHLPPRPQLGISSERLDPAACWRVSAAQATRCTQTVRESSFPKPTPPPAPHVLSSLSPRPGCRYRKHSLHH